MGAVQHGPQLSKSANLGLPQPLHLHLTHYRRFVSGEKLIQQRLKPLDSSQNSLLWAIKLTGKKPTISAGTGAGVNYDQNGSALVATLLKPPQRPTV